MESWVLLRKTQKTKTNFQSKEKITNVAFRSTFIKISDNPFNRMQFKLITITTIPNTSCHLIRQKVVVVVTQLKQISSFAPKDTILTKAKVVFKTSTSKCNFQQESNYTSRRC